MADGKGCECGAYGSCECVCPDVDWTPQELIDLRAENLALKNRVAEFLQQRTLEEAVIQRASENVIDFIRGGQWREVYIGTRYDQFKTSISAEYKNELLESLDALVAHKRKDGKL